MAQNTQTSQTMRIGIRQFRDNFAGYVGSADQPIAITRHGDTVGYYIPARPRRSEDEKAALRQALAKLHEVLNEHAISSEEVFEQLQTEMRETKTSKKTEPEVAQSGT